MVTDIVVYLSSFYLCVVANFPVSQTVFGTFSLSLISVFHITEISLVLLSVL